MLANLRLFRLPLCASPSAACLYPGSPYRLTEGLPEYHVRTSPRRVALQNADYSLAGFGLPVPVRPVQPGGAKFQVKQKLCQYAIAGDIPLQFAPMLQALKNN